jgi:hypothetical protein
MKWPIRIIIVVATVGLVIIIGLLVLPGKLAIPDSIKSHLGSTLLVPSGSDYTGSHSSAKYDSSKQLLAYRINIAGATSVVVSEQPAPPQFADITTYTDHFVNDLGEYKSFGSPNGTIYLYHPKNAPQLTNAFLLSSGTLMFVKPDNNLTEAQWHAFFTAVQVVR